jgi:hypothetical protein
MTTITVPSRVLAEIDRATEISPGLAALIRHDEEEDVD